MLTTFVGVLFYLNFHDCGFNSVLFVMISSPNKLVPSYFTVFTVWFCFSHSTHAHTGYAKKDELRRSFDIQLLGMKALDWFTLSKYNRYGFLDISGD